jgi:hypothetical protein
MAGPSGNGNSGLGLNDATVELRPGEPLSKRALFASLGTTGLGRFGGWVQDEVLVELQGRKWRETVREMLRDPTLSAATFAIQMLSRQVEWFCEPADDTAAAKEIAEFCDSCLLDMSRSWGDTLTEILSMLPFGWSYNEIVYKIRKGPDQNDPRLRSKFDDGKIGWRKIELRAQETLDHWEFDESGGVQGMWQWGPPDYQLHYVPIDKALLFRTSSRKNNPEGESLLFATYRPWYFKRNIENIEGIGIERDLAGLPVMRVPGEILDPNATSGQVAQRMHCEKIVRRIRRDEEEGILIPGDRDEKGQLLYDLVLLSSSGSRQFDIDKVLQRKAVEMLMNFLADFMLVGHEKVGSFALSTSKINLFTTALGTFLDTVAEIITEHGFTRLLQVNSMDVKLRPTLKHGNIEPRDLTELGTFLSSLAQAGAPIFPNPELMQTLFDAAGLPAPPEPEEEDVPPVPIVGPEARSPSAPAPDPAGQPRPPGAPAPPVDDSTVPTAPGQSNNRGAATDDRSPRRPAARAPG